MTELLNLSLRESADSLWRELNSAWSPPFWHFPQLKAADEGRNRDWTLNWQLWFYSFRKVMVPISSPNTKYIHKFVFWLCNPSYRELVYFLWLCLKPHDVQEKKSTSSPTSAFNWTWCSSAWKDSDFGLFRSTSDNEIDHFFFIMQLKGKKCNITSNSTHAVIHCSQIKCSPSSLKLEKYVSSCWMVAIDPFVGLLSGNES